MWLNCERALQSAEMPSAGKSASTEQHRKSDAWAGRTLGRSRTLTLLSPTMKTLKFLVSITAVATLASCASGARWHNIATEEIKAATEKNDQPRLAAAYENRGTQWLARAENPANYGSGIEEYVSSDYIAAAKSFTIAKMPAEAARVLDHCHRRLAKLGGGKDCDDAYSELLRLSGDRASYEHFQRYRYLRDRDRAHGLTASRNTRAEINRAREEQERKDALDREETTQNIAILLNGVAEAKAIRRGQPQPSTYYPTTIPADAGSTGYASSDRLSSKATSTQPNSSVIQTNTGQSGQSQATSSICPAAGGTWDGLVKASRCRCSKYEGAQFRILKDGIACQKNNSYIFGCSRNSMRCTQS